MEIREHITGFYEAIAADQRINPTHISLYMALYYQWICREGESPINVNRDMLMSQAKISARSTYNKCMRDLHEFGYIKYIPSYSFYLGSLVYINRI